jgi:hypothetical protein
MSEGVIRLLPKSETVINDRIRRSCSFVFESNSGSFEEKLVYIDLPIFLANQNEESNLDSFFMMALMIGMSKNYDIKIGFIFFKRASVLKIFLEIVLTHIFVVCVRES